MIERIIANLGPDFDSSWNSVVNGAKLGTLVSLVVVLAICILC